MRRYYIDNLRIICIFLLFPFHTAMIYNDFGERWYVHGRDTLWAGLINFSTYSWWMPLLFVLAGISTVYALKRRSGREYMAERTKKLLIPFISALLLLIPIQTYCADLFYNNYEGSYLSHFKEFFYITDLSGADGHFTPGQTWFILYLYVICLITLPLILWYRNRLKKIDGQKLSIPKLLPMFILLIAACLILDIGGKSIGEFAACFLLGYFVLSIDEVQDRLERNCIPLGIAWILLIIVYCGLCYTWYHMNDVFHFEEGLFGDIIGCIQRLYSWIGILACLGLGRRFLNFNSKVTAYFTSASFPLYLFHQSVIVIIGYFLVNRLSSAVLEYLVILSSSFVVTVLCYEICRRFKLTRILFGISSKRKIEKQKAGQN